MSGIGPITITPAAHLVPNYTAKPGGPASTTLNADEKADTTVQRAVAAAAAQLKSDQNIPASTITITADQRLVSIQAAALVQANALVAAEASGGSGVNVTA